MEASSSSLSNSSTVSPISVSQIPITTNQNIEADNLVDCIPTPPRTPPSSSSPKPVATVLGILPIFNKTHISLIQSLVYNWVVGFLLLIAETIISLTLFLIPSSIGSSSSHAAMPGNHDSSSRIRSSEIFPYTWEVILFWILIGLTWLTWIFVLGFGINAIKRVSSKIMGMCFQCHIVLVVMCLATVSFFIPSTPLIYHSTFRSPPWQRNVLMLLNIIMTLSNILAAITTFRISANFNRSSFERPPTGQRTNYNTFSNVQESRK